MIQYFTCESRRQRPSSSQGCGVDETSPVIVPACRSLGASTARAVGPTSRSTKRYPRWASFNMAGIIPVHSHYYARETPRLPISRAAQDTPNTPDEQESHIQQRSRYDGPVTQVRSATMSGTPNQGPGLRYPSNKKSIYDRNLNRSKNAELSRAAFAYLFIEMIAYAQRGVSNVGDLEQRYATFYYKHAKHRRELC